MNPYPYRTRPSNVRVCQFRHDRILLDSDIYYTRSAAICQYTSRLKFFRPTRLCVKLAFAPCFRQRFGIINIYNTFGISWWGRILSDRRGIFQSGRRGSARGGAALCHHSTCTSARRSHRWASCATKARRRWGRAGRTRCTSRARANCARWASGCTASAPASSSYTYCARARTTRRAGTMQWDF